MVEYPYLRRYLFTALESSPQLFEALLEGLTTEEADRRPDPERFTIREVMAHLADWETIFLDRMKRICTENNPLLENIDEGQRAIDQHYGNTDPAEQTRLFQERRAATIEFLQARADGEWQRTGNRPEIGRITVETMATLMPLHDLYHLQQVAAWRRSTRRN